MKGASAEERHAELCAMQLTRRQAHPDQVRSVGAALAAVLPRIIATAAERVKRGARQGQVSP